MKYKLLAALTIATSVLSAPLVFSETTPVEVPPNPILADVHDGTAKHLTYELEAVAYLLFIPVTGKATFEADLHDTTYDLKTSVKTTGIADIFVDYDMQIFANGYVQDNGLKTYYYVSQNNDGKKNRRVQMTYGAADVEMIATPEFGNLGFPPATPKQKLAANDPTSELISQMFEPRTEDNPCGPPIDTFDGRQLTRLSFIYQGETIVKTKAYKGPAYECHVDMARVAGYKKGDKGKNLSGIDGPMKAYFAPIDHGMVALVKLVVDTDKIGKITLSAKRLKLTDVLPPEASAGDNAG